MKIPLLQFWIGLFASTLMLAFYGCGGGGDSAATPSQPSPGPAGGSSFSGTTITINPTLTFVSGTNVEYLNTESGSAFPAANSSLTATFSYAPTANDYSSGTLTIILPTSPNYTTLIITLNGFKLQGGNVVSFNAVYGGQTYAATVSSGTLASSSSSTNQTQLPVTPTPTPNPPDTTRVVSGST
jgi:hypothetical protein